MSKHLGPKIGLTFVVTLAMVFSIRFLYGVESNKVHYHAGLAVYIDGARQEFENPGYYVETTACGGDFSEKPASRAHLHQPHPHVIHVHDKAVSWQNFFTNIGWGLNNQWLYDGNYFYQNRSGKKLRFILNGQFVDYPATKVIGNADIMLIDYGNDPIEVLHQRFIEIKREDVYKANLENDPASCSGQDQSSFFQRIIKALDIRQ